MSEKRIVLRKNRAHMVQFDAVDLPLWNQCRWHIGDTGYLMRVAPMVMGRRFSPIRFHREIFGLKNGDKRVVDHINHDQLDNRRFNLRVVSHQQNMTNMLSHQDANHPEVGVHYNRGRDRWIASVCRNGVRVSRTYRTEAEAVNMAREMRSGT